MYRRRRDFRRGGGKEERGEEGCTHRPSLILKFGVRGGEGHSASEKNELCCLKWHILVLVWWKMCITNNSRSSVLQTQHIRVVF